MSNLINKDLQFRLAAPLVRYSAQLTDEHQNVWRIDCTGLPELVEKFVEQRGVFVKAEVITRERAEALKRELAEHTPLRERAAASTLVAGGTPVAESTAPLQASYEGQEEPPLVVELEQTSPEAPALSVDLVLLQTATQGPQRITFEIDPSVTQQDAIFRTSFTVAKGDTTANVTCTPIQGQVGMWLESPRVVRAVGGSAKAMAAEGSVWDVKVQWVQGAPAVFNLSGDVVVI